MQRMKTSKIFISYRRGDSAGHTGRLCADLMHNFGNKRIFMDIHIEPGANFIEVIENAIRECNVLITVIGTRWSNISSERGRRLDDPDDFVRLEIATALKRGVRVIPVLVDGANLPQRDELPDELKDLTQRQAIEISNRRWDYDVKQLINSIQRKPTWKIGKGQLIIIASSIAIFLSLLMYFTLRPHPNNSYAIENQSKKAISETDSKSQSSSQYISSIPIPCHGVSVSFNPENHRIYAVNFPYNNDGTDDYQKKSTLTIIDEASNAIIKTVEVGRGAGGVAVNPRTWNVYVSNQWDNVVSVIDDARGERAEVKVGIFPGSIAINPATNKIYVANFNSSPESGKKQMKEGDGTVSVIDGNIQQEIMRIPIGLHAAGIGVDLKTNQVYVCNYTQNTIDIIDGNKDKIIGHIPVDYAPSQLVVDDLNNRVYVTHNRESGIVSVIDSIGKKVVARINVDSNPTGIVLNQKLNHIYVANESSNTISVIDGSTNQVIGNIKVDQNPLGLAVNSISGRIYVANYTGCNIAVIQDIGQP